MSVINTQRQTLIPSLASDTATRASSRPAGRSEGQSVNEASKAAAPAATVDVANTTRLIEAENLSAALPAIDDAVGALAATQLAKSLMASNSQTVLQQQSQFSAQNVLNLLQS